jgi:hypothetical protein
MSCNWCFLRKIQKMHWILSWTAICIDGKHAICIDGKHAICIDGKHAICIDGKHAICIDGHYLVAAVKLYWNQ